MSDAFECDGCGAVQAGRPRAELKREGSMARPVTDELCGGCVGDMIGELPELETRGPPLGVNL